MLELLDGFDVCDDIGARLKWNNFTATFDQSAIIAGRPGPSSSGANGRSLWLFNTAFGFAQYEHVWASGSQHVIGFHMDFRMLTQTGDRQATPINATVQQWFTISTPTIQVMALETIASGNLRIRGEGGTIIATPSMLFYYDTWYTLEGKFSFGTGGWELRVNQQSIASTNSPISSRLPDRAGFRWQGFGPPGLNLDNLVLWDGRNTDGLGFNDFLGPCRITALFPIRDLNYGWAPHPGPDRYTMLTDLPYAADGTHAADPNGSPDGDASYIDGGGAGPLMLNMSQRYDRLYSPCFGRVLAVAMNVVARPLAVNQAIEIIVQPLATLFILGVSSPINFSGSQFTLGQRAALNNYQAYQIITGLSPATNDVWTDAEIQSAAWGLGIHSTGQVRATQIYLEKLTTLLPRPYSCGGGNYSFTA